MASNRARTPYKDIDQVRKLLFDTIRARPGVSLRSVSEHIGKGQSYLSDFIWYGHGDLKEPLRHKMARHLDLPESDLRPPGLLAEPGIDYDRPPPVALEDRPVAPYEARDLMADLVVALDSLHREERLALSLWELGVAAWDMHQEIVAGREDLRAGLTAALRVHRRWLRNRRTEILGQRDLAS